MQQCTGVNANVSLADSYRQAVATNPPEVVALLRTPMQMRSKVSKRKRRQLPPLPDNIADIEIPPVYQRLQYANAAAGQPNAVAEKQFFQTKLVVDGADHRVEVIIIVFATDEFLRVLFNSTIAYADGTFYIAPHRFKQVLKV